MAIVDERESGIMKHHCSPWAQARAAAETLIDQSLT
jgi:hypothetical protein